jgi:hypothetical protein
VCLVSGCVQRISTGIKHITSLMQATSSSTGSSITDKCCTVPHCCASRAYNMLHAVTCMLHPTADSMYCSRCCVFGCMSST